MNSNNVDQTRQQKIDHLLATTQLGRIKQVTIVGDLFDRTLTSSMFDSPVFLPVKADNSMVSPTPNGRFLLDTIETLIMLEVGLSNSNFGNLVTKFSASRSGMGYDDAAPHNFVCSPDFFEALKMFYHFKTDSGVLTQNAEGTTPTILHQDLEKITSSRLTTKQKISAYRSVLKDYGIKLNHYHRISHLDKLVAQAIKRLENAMKNPVRLNDVFLEVNKHAFESIVSHKKDQVRRSLERLKHMGVIGHGTRGIGGFINKGSLGHGGVASLVCPPQDAGWYSKPRARYKIA